MNNRIVSLLNIAGVVTVSGILLAAFVMQIVYAEPPCPLCLLQRFAFMMIAAGFMLNIVFGIEQRHYGLVLLGALFGICASLRQIALHILPNTAPFGTDVFGLHFYSWAFICFVSVVLAVAVLLLLWNESWKSDDPHFPVLGKLACGIAVAVVAINVISVFMECGPLNCPDNPDSYWVIERVLER